MASLVSSVPLSLTTIFGLPRSITSRSSTCAPRSRSTKQETMVPKRPDWPWWLRLLVLLLFGVLYLPVLVFAVTLSYGGVCQ